MLFLLRYSHMQPSLIRDGFYNLTVQVFYGIIVLLITIATLSLYRTVSEVNPTDELAND